MTDAERFDTLAGALDPPMLVVTAASGGERDGCLVGFHSQCGIEPRRYAIWLSKPNRTARLAVDHECQWFGVHLLAPDQHHLAARFGAVSGDDLSPDEDKFDGCDWSRGPGGVPLLEEVANRFVGRRVTLTEVGSDHLCLVLDPTRARVSPRPEGPSGPRAWLRLGQVEDLDAGHGPDEPVASL